MKYEQELLDHLTATLAHRVKSFNVRFKEGANDSCAAAVAILLFGNTNTKLPGGYAGEEISANSPIIQVSEFPQELVLLGRATVMIRGIANRLGISWGLSDRWTTIGEYLIDNIILNVVTPFIAAMEALAATDPRDRLPIWAVAEPKALTSDASINRLSTDKANFQDVIKSFYYLAKTMKVTE